MNEGSGRESALTVTWRDDMPNGLGAFVEPDGGRIIGVWRDGSLTGLVREEHPDGNLRFLGRYGGGERNGDGIEVRLDGGVSVGSWSDGALHGTRCAHLFPCAHSGLALEGG